MEEASRTKPVWTPLKIIQWAVPYLTQKGIQNPKFDSEILIAHALGIDRLKVYLQFDRPLDASELNNIRESIKRRAAHEPVQYITGSREFFGIPFKVAPGVLIPRPETEHLVEAALDHLKKLPEEERLVLDLGTGSGCIALSLAKTLPCRIWAIDISAKALNIAKENAVNLGVSDRIEWREGDWFDALTPDDPHLFKVILSNPPYIPTVEKDGLAIEVRDFEPSEALFAGESGLAAYENLAESLPGRLASGGVALLELHDKGYNKVRSLFEGRNLGIKAIEDLQGFVRVLELIN